jgi:hypothetical protein
VSATAFLLPWEKVARFSGSDEGEARVLWVSLISHAPHASFSQGRSGALALAIAALLLSPGIAHACSCIRIAPEGFRMQAAAIVEGRVLAVKREGGINGRAIARIAVSKRVKGATPRTVTVTTAGNSAACGVDFTPGQTGEFLLRRDQGRFTTNLCLMIGARR